MQVSGEHAQGGAQQVQGLQCGRGRSVWDRPGARVAGEDRVEEYNRRRTLEGLQELVDGLQPWSGLTRGAN